MREGLGGEGDAEEEAPGGSGVNTGHRCGFQADVRAEDEGEVGQEGEFSAEAKGLGVGFGPEGGGGVIVFLSPEGEGKLVFDEGGSIGERGFEGEAKGSGVAAVEVPSEGSPDVAIGGELSEGAVGIAADMEAEVGMEEEGETGEGLLNIPAEQGGGEEGEAHAAHGLVIGEEAQSQVQAGIEAGEEAVGEFGAEVDVAEHLTGDGAGF